jgi:hypothetical protein
MHALIRQGNGKYYVSAVFGYYKDVKSEDDYQRYLESIHSPYYVVFDSEKTHLIKWFAMQPDTKYLIPQLLIVEADQSNWKLEEDYTGGVNFLTRDVADKIIATQNVPKDILEQCLEIDREYIYNEYPEICNEKDIQNLDWASGNFHDARIKEQKILEDGSLYLKFDGVWGGSIEVWFWGDLEYNTDSRDPEYSDPFWYGSTIILQDGFVYFVDEEDMKVEDIGNGYCWFKARHMKYHIIPD